jgi:hypothetical protein
MFQNIHLVEQSTFVSDFILALIAGFLSLKLGGFTSKSAFSNVWSGYFKLLALTALVGGFGHLLTFHTGVWLRLVSWLLGLFAIYFLEKEMLKQVILPTFFNYIPPIKGLIFAAFAICFQVFTPVKVGITLGMVFIVCPSLFYLYHRSENKGYLLILAFILANGLAGIAHSQNICLADWCNGNDLAHYISAVCLIGNFLGVKSVLAAEKVIAREVAVIASDTVATNGVETAV